MGQTQISGWVKKLRRLINWVDQTHNCVGQCQET